MTNELTLIGKATGVFSINHTFKGENGEECMALETDIHYISKNKIINNIKVIVFKGTKFEHMLSKPNGLVEIKGAIHSFNKNAWGKRINELFISPNSIKELHTEQKHVNKIHLSGQLCGEPHFKKRLNGNAVTEAKLKINRANGRFDYIPFVAFGDNAYVLDSFSDGESISLEGRIHSRTFKMKYRKNGQQIEEERTILEVGVHDLKISLPESERVSILSA